MRFLKDTTPQFESITQNSEWFSMRRRKIDYPARDAMRPILKDIEKREIKRCMWGEKKFSLFYAMFFFWTPQNTPGSLSDRKFTRGLIKSHTHTHTHTRLPEEEMYIFFGLIDWCNKKKKKRETDVNRMCRSWAQRRWGPQQREGCVCVGRSHSHLQVPACPGQWQVKSERGQSRTLSPSLVSPC